jgi:hypothetical protein
MYWRTKVAVSIVGACVAFVPLARAADPLKQTPFVTNEPMEVPGMMLAPGRYVFRLVEPSPERNVLQVFEVVQLWSGDESRVLSTLLTMPNYDLPTTDKTVFAFFERGPKQAKALRLWFPPGRNYGQEFVYPKAQAIELAKAVGRGVLSMPPELPGDIGLLAGGVQRGAAPAPARVPVAAPAMQPLPQRVPPPEPPKASNSMMQSRSRASSQPMPREPQKIAAALPKTASYLPVSAVLGILGMAAGVLLRLLAMRLERR